MNKYGFDFERFPQRPDWWASEQPSKLPQFSFPWSGDKLSAMRARCELVLQAHHSFNIVNDLLFYGEFEDSLIMDQYGNSHVCKKVFLITGEEVESVIYAFSIELASLSKELLIILNDKFPFSPTYIGQSGLLALFKPMLDEEAALACLNLLKEHDPLGRTGWKGSTEQNWIQQTLIKQELALCL
jgi:hypothetical protein